MYKRQTYYYNPLNYSLYGPTSVNTCARDLVRILSEYENPKLFSRETVDTVLKAVSYTHLRRADGPVHISL